MVDQEQPHPAPEPEPSPTPEADVRESFKGRIKSEPTLGTTSKGRAKFYAKVEQRHWRYEPDGTYTRLPNTYHDLVAYKGAAVRAYKQLAKNDYFIAEGRMEEYLSKRTGEMKQRFAATGFGHDMAHTRYEVDRSPRRDATEHQATERQAAERGTAAQHTPEADRSRLNLPPAGPWDQAPGFATPEQRPEQQPPAMGL
ncbi:MAG: single-stranded DNA-binding protein [Brachybacterium sp.]|nr:single-stranded DNA-binding protein [Brachybacterium sp.]